MNTLYVTVCLSYIAYLVDKVQIEIVEWKFQTSKEPCPIHHPEKP